jgi:hypothetical protein
MTVATKVAVIAITAVLYAVAKALTSFIPTPFGVGQLLIGIFVPAFMAVIADTLSVAIGAGLGTFIGDAIFLSPQGSTNPALSLIAGVPANFIAFLLFGWFVKKYKSWSAFVAATVSFVTLGNLIAATSIVIFGASVFTALGPLTKAYSVTSLILGFTVFWTATMIPAILVAVPLLVRAIEPLQGRSPIVKYYPSWSMVGARTQIVTSAFFAALLLVLGVLYFIVAPSSLGAVFPGLEDFLVFAVASLIILGPIVGILAGSRAKPAS